MGTGTWHIGNQPDLCWTHLDGRDPESVEWLDAQDLPLTARIALMAVETRPRCQPLEQGTLINLRGLRKVQDEEGDALVSIRVWAEKGRVISVSFRQLAGLDELCEHASHQDYKDPGDLIAAIAIMITRQLDPVVADLGDKIDDCELGLDGERAYELRREITKARSEAISYRRFIVPQRQALETMSTLQTAWIEDDDRIHIREAADRFARMAEELEAVRERSALLHEQITDLRAEKIDRRSLAIAVVAMIFLPLTFVTGLLGMNVDGIPYAHHPYSFWVVTAFCVFVGVSVTAYFVIRNWFRG
ncbi:zinc transporter ZntB [Sphingomonas montanisoli]|uniref:zinc transporter ZntB n=1 Tax=Sphingomonas montanisoli TaxID=2606412 RepID=UPI001FE511C1|nr:zinc transporter ZntB [Sphingomonas montanisoli]